MKKSKCGNTKCVCNSCTNIEKKIVKEAIGGEVICNDDHCIACDGLPEHEITKCIPLNKFLEEGGKLAWD